MEKRIKAFVRYALALFLFWTVVAEYYAWVAVISIPLFAIVLWQANRLSLRAVKLPGMPVILLIAFGLRMFVWFWLGVDQFADFDVYRQMAGAIQHGDYLFCLEKQTGPSIFYALSGSVTGDVLTGGLALNMVLRLTDVYLAYAIGIQVLSVRAGKAAALFVALFPDHIYFTRLLSSEVFFSTGILLTTLFILRSRRNALYLIPAGMVIGLLNYIRPNALLVLVAVLATVLVSGWPSRHKKLVWVLIPVYLIMNLPLILFNYRHMDRLSVMPAQVSGLSMLFATTNRSSGAFQLDQYNLFLDLIRPREKVHPLVAANREARQMAIERIRQHPGQWLAYTLAYRMPFQFGGSTIRWSWENAPRPVALTHLVSAVLCSMVSLGLIALLAIRRFPRGDLYLFFSILLILTILMHFFTEVNPRYNHHIMLMAGILVSIRLLPGNEILQAKTPDSLK